MNNRVSWISVMMLSAAVALAGCGTGDGYAGPAGTVSGKVTFKGMPVPAGCGVTFWGTNKAGYIAVGSVTAGGSYSLRVSGSEKVPTGSYQVTVSPPPSTTPVDEKAVAEAMAKPVDNDQVTPDVAPALPFPSKYLDQAASGLKFDVKEGPNTIDIAMTE